MSHAPNLAAGVVAAVHLVIDSDDRRWTGRAGSGGQADGSHGVHVYISVDMEGVAGVATMDQVFRGAQGYSSAQELMTAETNSAIAGAFDGGATAVTVNDSHGTMDNLLHERLDDRARVVFGAPKGQCMAQDLDGTHDVAFFYHAAAGESGVLSHTFSSFFSGVRLNGTTVSEAQVNALYAASHGVPVGLLTGDTSICDVSDRRSRALSPCPSRHPKAGRRRTLHPGVARQMIHASAARAVAASASLGPVEIPDRLVLDVDMQVPTAVELAAMIPGAEQTAQFTVSRKVDDPAELLGLISVWYALAAEAMRGRAPLLR